MLFFLLFSSACTFHHRGIRAGAGSRVEYGLASWYGRDFHGKRTANGEIYDMYKLTAAHRSLPLGTLVRVTNRRNGKSVVVRINDRGPFVRGRIIDLSYGAARALAMTEDGVVPVRVDTLQLGDNYYYKQGGVRRGIRSGTTYTVQVGSYLRRTNALQLKSALATRFGNVFIREWYDQGRIYYRVRIGRFSREEDARKLSHRLWTQHISSFVTDD